MGKSGPIVDLMRPAPGIVRCCLCFRAFKEDELYVDAEGQKWDTCVECQRIEDLHLELERRDEVEKTHSWVYGHDYVRCAICGANKASERGRAPCGLFGSTRPPCVRE